MSDDDGTPEELADRPGELGQHAVSGSAAARAASRARRIGGVTRPAPTQAPPPPTTSTASEPAATAEPEATVEAPAAERRPSPVPRTRADARADDSRERVVRRARLLRWVPAAVAAALVVALAVVDVIFLQNWRDQPGKAERRERLIAATNAAVARVLSYDYRHIDSDANAAEAVLTGTLKRQYVASMNTTIKPNAPTEKAVVVGQVVSTAITSVSGDEKQAVMLVLGQQTVTNTKQTTPSYDPVSLRVTMQQVHGKWLIADLSRL